MCPWFSLYLHIFPVGEIFPLSLISQVIPNPLTILSSYGYDLRNSNLSKLPHLSRNSSITPQGEIMPLSSVSPVLSGPSTTLSLSLPVFKFDEKLNLINQIDKVPELKPVSTSELNYQILPSKLR